MTPVSILSHVVRCSFTVYTGFYFVKVQTYSRETKKKVLSAMFIRMHRCGFLSSCTTSGNKLRTLCVSSVTSALILKYPCVLIEPVITLLFSEGLEVT